MVIISAGWLPTDSGCGFNFSVVTLTKPWLWSEFAAGVGTLTVIFARHGRTHGGGPIHS